MSIKHMRNRMLLSGSRKRILVADSDLATLSLSGLTKHLKTAKYALDFAMYSRDIYSKLSELRFDGTVIGTDFTADKIEDEEERRGKRIYRISGASIAKRLRKTYPDMAIVLNVECAAKYEKELEGLDIYCHERSENGSGIVDYFRTRFGDEAGENETYKRDDGIYGPDRILKDLF